jgi:hypothetical protein
MAEITIELCPETGICSLVKPGSKTDLMPGEVADLKEADGTAGIKAVIAEVDPTFANNLSDEDVAAIVGRLTK